MRNKILTTIFMTSMSIGLIVSPTALVGYEIDKNSKWLLGDNTDKEHPEKMYGSYYNVDTDVMPWDLFGDWVIPEGPVNINYDLMSLWNGTGDYWENPMNELWIVSDSYFEDYKSTYKSVPIEVFQRHNWHNTYQNWIMPVPDESGRYWDEKTNSWEVPRDWNHGFSSEDAKIVSRTPMRGIIPYWENTNAFNTYVLNETDGGTKDSINLTYESGYASYINEYVSSTESTYPVIYKYLDDTSLLYDLYITNDKSVEWILPDDYQLVNSDDLTNAFVGFDNTWEVVPFMEYIFDFTIWNWNTNVYPSKNNLYYYEDLKEINSGDIDIEVLNSSKDYSRVQLRGDGIQYDDSYGEPIEGVTMEEYQTYGVWVSNEGSDGIYTSDDIAEYFQTIGIVFDKGKDHETPSYRWSQEDQWNSAYEDEDDYFEMHNPFNQQMNVNITPTIISFEGLDERFNEQISIIEENEESEKLYIESKVSEFTTPFEEWLINSETGINKYFVDFYADCHVNDYYNNYGGDGTAFLGRNRFQSGIYPVEDLRLNDLIITYTDQDGNKVNEDTLLGDINELNISIEFNYESDNVKLFDTTGVSPVSMSFDTSSLETNVPPVTPDEDESHKLLIIVIALLILSAVGAIVAIMMKKNKNNKT